MRITLTAKNYIDVNINTLDKYKGKEAFVNEMVEKHANSFENKEAAKKAFEGIWNKFGKSEPAIKTGKEKASKED